LDIWTGITHALVIAHVVLDFCKIGSCYV